jgi:hypothetical protein
MPTHGHIQRDRWMVARGRLLCWAWSKKGATQNPESVQWHLTSLPEISATGLCWHRVGSVVKNLPVRSRQFQRQAASTVRAAGRQPTHGLTAAHSHPSGTGPSLTPPRTNIQPSGCPHLHGRQSSAEKSCFQRRKPRFCGLPPAAFRRMVGEPFGLPLLILPSFFLIHSYSKRTKRRNAPSTEEPAVQGHASQPCVGYTGGLHSRAIAAPASPSERTAVFR